MGSVTMLMLLMPDCRSASTTAAKLPKGTVSSQRRKTPSCLFFNCDREEDTFLPVFQLRLDPWAELMNVDGFIAKVNALRLVHGDDQALLIDFLYSARLWDVDFDAGLEDRGGDHENNQQHENHVHERDHVDLGERSLRRFGELRHLL